MVPTFSASSPPTIPRGSSFTLQMAILDVDLDDEE